MKPQIINCNSAESLCDVNLDTDFAVLPTEYADLGENFKKHLNKCNFTPEKKTEIKRCAATFLKELFVGLQKRIKPSLLLLKKTEPFQLPAFLNTNLHHNQLCDPFFPQDSSAQGELESKCRLLKEMVWDKSSTEAFWIEVHEHVDASGSYPFRCLRVLKMFCLPTSNTEIERVFSHVSLVKSRRRNRMTTDTLENVLSIRFGLKRIGQTVDEFKPPISILKYDSKIYD